jgi:26S proteasome regulatory subunit T5
MSRIRMLDGNMRIMRNEKSRVEHECSQFLVRIKDNEDKIEKNRVLPYLVANIVEVIDMKPEDEIDPEAVQNKDDFPSKCAIVKTTTRQVFFSNF